MLMTKRVLKSRTITVDDYYGERFLRIETELSHQRELMKIGFETMNKRFESIDKRFESVDKRFEELTKRMDGFMRWSFGMTLTSTGIIIAAMKFLK